MISHSECAVHLRAVHCPELVVIAVRKPLLALLCFLARDTMDSSRKRKAQALNATPTANEGSATKKLKLLVRCGTPIVSSACSASFSVRCAVRRGAEGAGGSCCGRQVGASLGGKRSKLRDGLKCRAWAPSCYPPPKAPPSSAARIAEHCRAANAVYSC